MTLRGSLKGTNGNFRGSSCSAHRNYSLRPQGTYGILGIGPGPAACSTLALRVSYCAGPSEVYEMANVGIFVQFWGASPSCPHTRSWAPRRALCKPPRWGVFRRSLQATRRFLPRKRGAPPNPSTGAKERPPGAAVAVRSRAWPFKRRPGDVTPAISLARSPDASAGRRPLGGPGSLPALRPPARPPAAFRAPGPPSRQVRLQARASARPGASGSRRGSGPPNPGRQGSAPGAHASPGRAPSLLPLALRGSGGDPRRRGRVPGEVSSAGGALRQVVPGPVPEQTPRPALPGSAPRRLLGQPLRGRRLLVCAAVRQNACRKSRV